ncbi:Rab1a [Hexamita inflata]|uniref:Rab1a n=1 Tax=Hexamita inflata TaxID=28002 RepID=A0AA86PP21_9EUKA|nr:Rab1a [Hexamita inflata]CAI9943081.1 Rab1a [Hexamita inflata]
MNSYKNDYKIVMESSVTDGLFDSIQTYEYTKFENVYQQQKRFNEVHEYNIAVMGISQAGQTSLCKRLSKNTFSKTKHTTKQDKYVAYLESVNVKLNLYDLVGMRNQNIIEENQTVIRGSQYAFIVFSVVDPNWHQQVINWISFVKSANSKCIIVLIGNKSDVEIDQNKIFQLTNKIQTQYFIRCSVKTGDNISQIQEIQWIEDYDFESIYSTCCD